MGKRRLRGDVTAFGRATRYRVLVDGLAWPTGASYDLVVARGGQSKLTPAERAALTMATPARGTIVSDVPAASLDWMIQQRWLEPVDAED